MTVCCYFTTRKNGTFKDVSSKRPEMQAADDLKPRSRHSSTTITTAIWICTSLVHSNKAPDRPQAVQLRKTPLPTEMWRNNGNGTFTEVTESLGLSGSERRSARSERTTTMIERSTSLLPD